ncbi:MAG: DUF3566 domain-containing protein [bacterium]|nr:DUF3566 domain-containing protein [bacterium]
MLDAQPTHSVHRVRRIIRRVDPWTVLKVSFIVYMVAAFGFMLASVMFWEVVERSGIPQKITDFLIQITLLDEGEAPFSNTEQFVRLSAILAVAWAFLSSGLTTLGAIMYNLVADVVGGVEVVLLEENVVPVLVAAPPSETVRVQSYTPAELPAPTRSDQPTMLVESE